MSNQCGLCSVPLDDGGRLCTSCTTATIGRLGGLHHLYDQLGDYLTPAVTGPGSGRTHHAHPPLPLSEHVLDLRAAGGMVGVVEGWHAAVRHERGMTEPRVEGAITRRLDRAVKGLAVNMPWISISWDQAGLFALEIRQLVTQIERTIDPTPAGERGTRLGSCPAVYDDGQTCGETLRLYPGDKAIACGRCTTVYPPATWLQLHAWMNQRIEVAA